jgi:hypothetical protein
MPDANGASNLSINHEPSTGARSSITHHSLILESERYTFDEDTKVGIYIVEGTQIPRFDDAMIRALGRFQNQLSKGDTAGREHLLTALEREIDRRVAMRRRER